MENEIMKSNDLIQYTKTGDIFADAKLIVQTARKRAYKMADTSLVMQNWLLGKRIAEEVLEGEDRAKYGAGVIKSLAAKLTAEFGKGFTQNNLYYCKQFYEAFPKIFHAPRGEIVVTLSQQLRWLLMSPLNKLKSGTKFSLEFKRELPQNAGGTVINWR